jgi:hypothetical protein
LVYCAGLSVRAGSAVVAAAVNVCFASIPDPIATAGDAADFVANATGAIGIAVAGFIDVAWSARATAINIGFVSIPDMVAAARG